jgi:hypothetical protein
MLRVFLILTTLITPAFAINWEIAAGVGIGRHSTPQSPSGNSPQNHWQFLSSVSSPLFTGLDARFDYSLNRGSYHNDYVADDSVGIAFRTSLSTSSLKLNAGMGLGCHHRENFTQSKVLNQTYIPVYLDFRYASGWWKPWKISLETHFYIQPPHPEYLKGFRTLNTRFIPSLRYLHHNTEYVLSYQTSAFAREVGEVGLNKNRFDLQIIYHFNR